MFLIRYLKSLENTIIYNILFWKRILFSPVDLLFLLYFSLDYVPSCIKHIFPYYSQCVTISRKFKYFFKLHVFCCIISQTIQNDYLFQKDTHKQIIHYSNLLLR